MTKPFAGLLALALCAALSIARAEDGYDLWLRYRPLQPEWIATYRHNLTELVLPTSSSKTLDIVRSELSRGLDGLLGAAPRSSLEPPAPRPSSPEPDWICSA